MKALILSYDNDYTFFLVKNPPVINNKEFAPANSGSFPRSL
jgi:hypothetical protein